MKQVEKVKKRKYSQQVLSGCGVSDGVGCSDSTVPKRVVF